MSRDTSRDQQSRAQLADLSAGEVIALLDLHPHPEGGHYRETFRDTANVGVEGRAASTAIYFLLAAGEVSRWHRVDAAEIWHWHAGAPLLLDVADDWQAAGSITRQTLGIDFGAGQRPQGIVPAGAWQRARSMGAWSLVGCTVAPGFLFERFELAGDGSAP